MSEMKWDEIVLTERAGEQHFVDPFEEKMTWQFGIDFNLHKEQLSIWLSMDIENVKIKRDKE